MPDPVVKRWRGQGEASNVAGFTFWCPGCDEVHKVWTEGPGPQWGWNGDEIKPTFTPSVKVTWPAKPDAPERFKEWRTERICHSLVTDGQIQFLSDCTHAMAGQTVPLPPLSTWRYS